MLIPVGFAQVNMVFGGAGLPSSGEVTFGVDNTGSSLTPVGIAGIVQLAWVNNLQAATNTNVTLESILVKLGPNSTGSFGSLAVAAAGANTTGDFNPAVGVIVRKQTALGGRHGRGRNYWPMAGEADTLTGGQLQPTFVTGVGPSMTGFLNDLAAGDCPMVLLHGGALPSPTPVTALSVESQIGVQRRRNRR